MVNALSTRHLLVAKGLSRMPICMDAETCRHMFFFPHRSLSEFSRPSMERSKQRMRNSKESFYKVPGNCYATWLARLDLTFCWIRGQTLSLTICCCPGLSVISVIGIDLALYGRHDDAIRSRRLLGLLHLHPQQSGLTC